MDGGLMVVIPSRDLTEHGMNLIYSPWIGEYSYSSTLDVFISVYGHNVHPEETSEQLRKALSQIIPSGASAIGFKVKANDKGNETYEFYGRKVVVSYGGLTDIEIHGKKYKEVISSIFLLNSFFI